MCSLVGVIFVRRQMATDHMSPIVKMSGLEERGVENPLAVADDEQGDFDKEAIINAMEHNK